MWHERQPQEGLPPIGCLRSAETVVATRKKSWRLDGHKLDRQRDWLGVSKTHPISSPRLVLPAVVADAVSIAEVLAHGEAARRYEECTGNGARSSSAGGPATCYFPRDLFFCFFTFKLTIGAFAAVPRETGLGTRCFFDFPAMPILLDRGRVATDDPTLQAVGGCAPLWAGRASRQAEHAAATKASLSPTRRGAGGVVRPALAQPP